MNTKGRLLIIDDDEILCNRLGKAMSKRGYEVNIAYSLREALEKIKIFEPGFAVVDLRLEDGNGLEIVEQIHKQIDDCRVVMLTAYGNIATAVTAIKVGAIDYLAKPADADAVERALTQGQSTDWPEIPEDPMSADRVKWEHILKVFEDNERDVSETARKLKMHRRTLQRILAKHAPRD